MSFAERDGPPGALGRELLDYAGLVFEYWHDYQDGKLTRERFVAWMVPVRQHVHAALQRAVDAGLGHVSGSCADVLAHSSALWTFVDHDGVPPSSAIGRCNSRAGAPGFFASVAMLSAGWAHTVW